VACHSHRGGEVGAGPRHRFFARRLLRRSTSDSRSSGTLSLEVLACHNLMAHAVHVDGLGHKHRAVHVHVLHPCHLSWHSSSRQSYEPSRSVIRLLHWLVYRASHTTGGGGGLGSGGCGVHPGTSHSWSELLSSGVKTELLGVRVEGGL